MKKLLAILLSLVLALNIALPALAEEPTPVPTEPTAEATTTTTEEEVTEEQATEEVVSVIIYPGQEDPAAPAEPPVNETPAGVTPDNTILYFFDKLLENIQLALAKTPEARAQLLTLISQERMAELEALDPAKLEKYVDTLLADITTSLQEAAEAITVAKEKGVEVEILAQNLEQAGKLGSAVQLPESILKNEKTEEAQKELEKTSKTAIVKAAVVRDVAPEVVEALRNQGLGFGQIALLNKMAVAIADAAEGEDNMEKVLAIFAETKSIGQTKQALGLNPGQAKKHEKAAPKTEKPETDEDEDEGEDDDKEEAVKGRGKGKEQIPADQKQNNGKGNTAKNNTPAKGKGK